MNKPQDSKRRFFSPRDKLAAIKRHLLEKAPGHIRWLGLAIIIVVCLAAGGLGAIATTSEIEGWYKTIGKPSWNPPDYIFGPVWTTLYVMMAVAAWLVWRPDEAKRIWPIGQLSDWGKRVPVEQVAAVLGYGSQQPATGIMAFHWNDLAKEWDKVEALKRAYRSFRTAGT